MPLLVTLLALLAAFALPARAEDQTSSPYLQPTKEILGRMRETRTPDQTQAYQLEILDWSDSLEAVGEQVLASQCLERAGILSYLGGDYDRALEIWDHGLDVARQSGDPKRIGALLNAQASGISAKGDNVRAALLFSELVDFRRRNDDRRGVGIALSNLAFSQIALFQYPEAIETVRQAAELHREVGNRSGLAHALLSLVDLLERAGRYEDAVAIADSAVANARPLGEAYRLAPALHARALLRAEFGDFEGALADYDESLQLLRDHVLTSMLGATQLNRAATLIELGRAEEAVAEAEAAIPLLDEGMDPAQSVTGRGTLGRALLHAGRADEARATLQEGIDRFQALQDSLEDPVQRAQANGIATPLSLLPILEIRAGRMASAWSIVESGLARQLRQSVGTDGRILPLEEFQAKLYELDAQALVVGVVSMEGCPVFLVGPRDVQGGTLRFDSTMRGDLRRVTDLAAAGAGDDVLKSPLARVSAAWRRALPELFDGDGHRLIVMPGGLGGFPFELLHDLRGDLLGDVYDLSYAPSATVLNSLESRAPKQRSFVALADPEGAPVDTEITDPIALRAAGEIRTPLPQARAEVRNIAPPQGRVLLGREATASAFFEEGRRASVLHLAMHASIDTQNPYASALLMAPDDHFHHGVVAAPDIARSRLSADLVSLSGCSTVGGYQVLGEGTFGLVRAFLEAGSRSVVASRWDVEDAAARRFMELFYDGLGRGEARDAALSSARRRMRKEGFGIRDRAAFALVGAVSGDLPELRRTGPRTRQWFALGAVVLVAFALLFGQRRRRAT